MLHYIPKKISELNAKSDVRVAVMGKIIKSSEKKFILSDDSGRVEINFDNASCLAVDSLVRAFCTISNDTLKADAVQDLSTLDVDLFMKIEELYRKADLNV
jgi:hypothetical protein